MDADAQGLIGGDGVMLGHILQKELQGARDDLLGEVFVENHLVHVEAFRERSLSRII